MMNMTITYADHYDPSFKIIDMGHQYPCGIVNSAPSDNSDTSPGRYIAGLYISAGGLKDQSLTPLIGCTDLTQLLISGNDIHDISWICPLRNLEELNISYNRIKDISPLKSLSNLRKVIMQNNDVEDISFVKEIQYLKTFNATLNHIVDLSPLEGNTSLKKLLISDNRIRDISPLRRTNIRDLYLSRNLISDISPLNDMQSLQTIFLSKNRITTISPLRCNDTIAYLNLKGNEIEDRAASSVIFTMSSIKALSIYRYNDIQFLRHMMTNIANGIKRRMTYHQILIDRTRKKMR
jgi:internalin A